MLLPETGTAASNIEGFGQFCLEVAKTVEFLPTPIRFDHRRKTRKTRHGMANFSLIAWIQWECNKYFPDDDKNGQVLATLLCIQLTRSHPNTGALAAIQVDGLSHKDKAIVKEACEQFHRCWKDIQYLGSGMNATVLGRVQSWTYKGPITEETDKPPKPSTILLGPGPGPSDSQPEQ